MQDCVKYMDREIFFLFDKNCLIDSLYKSDFAETQDVYSRKWDAPKRFSKSKLKMLQN